MVRFLEEGMENNRRDKLSKEMKASRLNPNLSKDEFARKTDIPYTTLTKVETGVIKKPSSFVTAKIAKALGFSIENLIK